MFILPFVVRSLAFLRSFCLKKMCGLTKQISLYMYEFKHCLMDKFSRRYFFPSSQESQSSAYHSSSSISFGALTMINDYYTPHHRHHIVTLFDSCALPDEPSAHLSNGTSYRTLCIESFYSGRACSCAFLEYTW